MFLLEAMACGVPVVQPRRGAFVEIVEKTGGGLLVAPDDPDALANAFVDLYKDRSATEALGNKGFQNVRTHYSVELSAERLLQVYESVFKRQTGAGNLSVECAGRQFMKNLPTLQ
jgi:glycosyltransferase involved in cell wall biosynthesis